MEVKSTMHQNLKTAYFIHFSPFSAHDFLHAHDGALQRLEVVVVVVVVPVVVVVVAVVIVVGHNTKKVQSRQIVYIILEFSVKCYKIIKRK